MGGLRRAHLLILLAAGVICLLTFQGRRVLTEHEVFAAEPGREMAAGQTWLLQPFAGEYRTKKPPGQSWLIAVSLFATRSHSEWAARLPSAMAGIGLAVVTAMIAARLGTSRQGLIAGLMTLTCVGVQQRARLAEADMALAFCVAVANAAVLRSLAGKAGRGPAVGFWLAVVFGFMLKGPIVLGFTALPTAVAWIILRFGTKDRSAATSVARAAFWWPAVLVGVALIVAWPVAAGLRYPPAWAQWRHEIIDRTQGDVGHGDEKRHDPLLAYAWLLPQSTLPWFPFALAGLWWLRGAGVFRRPANVLLGSWAVCGLAVVTAIAFKVLHYVLPVAPPVLMLAAVGFDGRLTRWLRSRPRRHRTAWERAGLAGWFGLVAIAWLVWAGVVAPKNDWGQKVRDFARRVDALVPAGQTVYFYHPTDARSGEDQTAWYLTHPLRQAAVVPGVRPAYLICGSDDLDTLSKRTKTTVIEAAEPVTARGGADRNDRTLVRVD